jgi:hypothetical protein
VRGLIVLLLVIAAVLGLVVRQAHIQRNAVAAIARAGGSVKCDWEWSNRNKIPGGTPPAPLRFVDQIGVDYFGHVTAVEFPMYPSATDATLAEIGCRTPHYRYSMPTRVTKRRRDGASEATDGSLDPRTRRNHVTDAGLAHLTVSIYFESLYLGDTRVTDAGAKELNLVILQSSFDRFFQAVRFRLAFGSAAVGITG